MLDPKLLGRRIQRYRRKKNLSAEKLAELIDVSVPYVRELERGAKTPSMKMFVTIANELEVTADELLCDSIIKDNQMVLSEFATLISSCSREKSKIILAVINSLIKEL